MNKNKIKKEIESKHQIFKGTIIKIINCEVQYWSDYSTQPTDFEFIVENDEGHQITVTGCFTEIYFYQNQQVLLILAPSYREPEKFSLTILIDLKTKLFCNDLFLDCGSNIIKRNFFNHFIFMCGLFILLTIFYLLFNGRDFYTIVSYQCITMMIICWVTTVGYIYRLLYRNSIYFDAIFEMLGIENAENKEISEINFKHQNLKLLSSLF